MISTTAVRILGLGLGVAGSVIIAIPLIRSIRTYFEFGKLREAKQSIRYGRLTQDDVGFNQVVKRHLENKEYGDEIEIDDVQYITHEPKLSADILNPSNSDETKMIGSSETHLIYVEYSSENSSIGSSYNSTPANFYQLFEQDMIRGEERIRLLGLSLLTVGFVLQILSIYL